MKYKLMLFVFISAIILSCFSCQSESSAPTAPNEIVLEIDTTFLSYDTLWAVGGPGYYSKPITIRNYQFDPLRGDSVVKMLLDSNIYLVEFWYPAGAGIARNPYMGMFEVAKLNQPDTAIYRFGYTPLDTITSNHYIFVRQWRHYKIVR